MADIREQSGGKEGVLISDALGTAVSAFPAGFLRVTDEPHQLFVDTFDSALDTTNRWTATSGNSAVLASNATGNMTMGSGTTASGWSKLISQPSFQMTIPSWLGCSDLLSLPDGAAPIANSYRYWGTGTTPATPSVATPVTDGYGFELNIDGKLRAVVYTGGSRTVIADLSSSGNNKQPLDALLHRYIIFMRTDKTFFYIDGLDSNSLVAVATDIIPQSQTLPKLMLAVGNTTPPVSNAQIIASGATAWDTGKNNITVSDGTLPYRKARVSSLGNFAVDDSYTSGQVLADQAGSGSVLTFTFTQQQNLVWVRCDGGQGRADPFGGTPATTTGIRCDDGIPNPMTINTTVVKVFANTGTTVQVWGYRY